MPAQFADLAVGRKYDPAVSQLAHYCAASRSFEFELPLAAETANPPYPHQHLPADPRSAAGRICKRVASIVLRAVP